MADGTKHEMENRYHTTLSSPFKQTPLQEIKKSYFDKWIKLTIDLINKHLPPSTEAAKGHMHQTSKKLN